MRTKKNRRKIKGSETDYPKVPPGKGGEGDPFPGKSNTRKRGKGRKAGRCPHRGHGTPHAGGGKKEAPGERLAPTDFVKRVRI